MAAAPAKPQAQAKPVRVFTTPPGARLVFDNDLAAACASPCEREFRAGSHELTVTLEGYRTVNTRFEVPSLTDLTIVLQKQGGVIAFDASLKGTRIFLDGREMAGTPPVEIALGPGDRHVRVVAGDAIVFDRVLNLGAGGRTLVRAPSPPAQP